MDWTRAKTILIAALLMTNLFLIFLYVSSDGTDEVEIGKADVKALLEEKNIFLETEIPDAFPDPDALTVNHTEFKEDEIAALTEALKPVPAGSTDREYVKAANEFFEYMGLSGEYLFCSDVEKSGDTVVLHYKTQVKGINVEASYMTCTFEDNRIQSVSGNWFEPQRFSKKKFENFLAVEALLSFVSDRPAEGPITINAIEPVYWIGDEYNEAVGGFSVTALPAWKITYNGEKIVYIDAFKV